VTEWLKSVLNYQSYPKIKLGIRFFGPPCTVLRNAIYSVSCFKLEFVMSGKNWTMKKALQKKSLRKKESLLQQSILLITIIKA